MADMHDTQPRDARGNADPSDFDRATAARLKANWRLPMNQRLAQVHRLSKQMTALEGVARRS